MVRQGIGETEVKVKPLLWRDTRGDGTQWANTIFGLQYCASEKGWGFRNYPDQYPSGGGIEKAKAAAQADYETRILSALESTPTQSDWAPIPTKPTNEQIYSACMSFRHDFGYLSPDVRERIVFYAKEWLRAWQKEAPQKQHIDPDLEPGDYIVTIKTKGGAAEVNSQVQPAAPNIDPRVLADPCIQKLLPDEPFFVLLGRDVDAAKALEVWINQRVGKYLTNAKIVAAQNTLLNFEAYAEAIRNQP